MIGPSVWAKWPVIAKKLGSIGVVIAILMLVQDRESLLSNNMFETNYSYPDDVVCSERALEARIEDGTCNNLDLPAMGAAGIRFGRNVPLENAYGESGERLLTPNPRDISRDLLSRDEFIPASTLNFMAAAWIQFMVHDWVSHGANDEVDPIKVPLKSDDPFGSDYLEIQRTRRDPSTLGESGPQTYTNVNTHWWDGSQIYGSNLETNNTIRSFVDGKLKVSAEGRLPTDLFGIPVTGFNDNWWLGLSMFHQIFVLEHNAIADMLKLQNPDWEDQKLYDKARLINAAVMAKIHTVEWTPAILDNPVLRKGMDTNWWGLVGKENQKNFQKIVEGLARSVKVTDKALKRITGKNDTLESILNNAGSIERAVTGLVGARTIELYDMPYTLTEEFVSVYRMHPLLRDSVDLYSRVDGQAIASIPLNETRRGNAEQLMDDYQIENLWYSFGVTHPGALTLQNYPKFLQNLDIPLVGNIDLASIDIIRDRERGVPRYNEFRRLLQMTPINKFEDLTTDPVLVEKLKRLYQNDVELIDLMVGSFAESVRPEGFGFGETSFQIFLINASRRLMSDHFFTVDYTEEMYTPEGMAWINDTLMTDVLKRHFPGLNANLKGVKNAFKPWKQ